MSNIWNTQTFLNSTWLINTVKLKLRDQFEQTWHSLIDDSPKANNYKLFKTSFQIEDYFELREHKKAIDFCRFRTTNHKFPIEQGRWDNIDRNNRICFLCNSDIGDEFNYILQCQYFKPSRKLLLSKYYNNHVNVLKFRYIMTSKNKTVHTKLCKLIKIIEKVICDPG
jgi:hypothetical protein